MSGIAINEPEGVRERTLTPASPNEPPALPEWATEAPVVTGLEPAECTLGDPDFRIYVSGTGFYEQSTLVFAGQDEPTTFEDGKLSTGVNMAMWQGPDTVQVGVRNGPIESNTMPFTFNAAETPEAEGQWRTTSVTTATPPSYDADRQAKPPYPHADTHPDDIIDPTDPDELEDELDQAREEGDFTPARGKRR